MAIVIGQSQAWRELLQGIGGDYVQCRSTLELQAAIDFQRTWMPTWRSKAEAIVDRRIAQLNEDVQAGPANISTRRAEIIAQAKPRIADLKRRRQALAGAPWFARWFNSWFRVPAIDRTIQRVEHSAQSELRAVVKAFEAIRAELELQQCARGRSVTSLVQGYAASLLRAETAVNSAEYAGAAAELRMIDLLREGLPDAFHVMNNVQIELDKWVYFENQHRKTAQIDHVVVGPTGVYSIEVKCWSANFTDRGDFHDPYDQARTAGYLCYKFLYESLGHPIKVREVIASTGRLPPQKQGHKLQVSRPEALAGLIRNGKTQLSRIAVTEIVNILRKCQ